MASSPNSSFTIAAVQMAPVFLDREATVEKVCGLISTAAQAGAKLIVFPEVLIPAYPDWVWVLPARERIALNALYAELVENAVTIPSETTRRLCEVARQAEAFVVIGVNERNTEASGSSLYNTLLFIDAGGEPDRPPPQAGSYRWRALDMGTRRR